MSRKNILLLTAISLALMGGSFIHPKTDLLIWNRTESAPIGLYWRSNGPLTLNGWAIVSARSEAANWASSHGYTGPDWPLIKQIRALPGDEICRQNEAILINQTQVTEALLQAPGGLDLPRWQGCHILQYGEVFLLNDHPRSVDGRYFGVMKQSDLDGMAILVWRLR